MREGRYLTRAAQYESVYSKGGSWVGDLVVVKALPNGLDLHRCGFSIGRRVGKAVARNRVKRLLREVLRQTPLKPGWDIIVIARPPAAKANYRDLETAVNGLLFRAGLSVGEYEEVCPRID